MKSTKKKNSSKRKSGIRAKDVREKTLNMISYWNQNEGRDGEVLLPYIIEKP